MLLIVDPRSGVPVYRQIMEQIKLQITSEILKAGDTLPSTRALSAELGINPMTISKAYNFLEKEDVVIRRPGRPLIVKELSAEEKVQSRQNQLKQILDKAVTTATQLHVSKEEALKLFAVLLNK
jgi:GntR family transcriptional regulator